MILRTGASLPNERCVRAARTSNDNGSCRVFTRSSMKRAIFFGVGAVVGSTTNYGFTRYVGRSAKAFFQISFRRMVMYRRHSPGMRRHVTSSAIGIASMAPSLHADCTPWASATNPSRQHRLGRTVLPNGCRVDPARVPRSSRRLE